MVKLRALVGVRRPPPLSGSELSTEEGYQPKEEPRGCPAACWQTSRHCSYNWAPTVWEHEEGRNLWWDAACAWAGKVHEAKHWPWQTGFHNEQFCEPCHTNCLPCGDLCGHLHTWQLWFLPFSPVNQWYFGSWAGGTCNAVDNQLITKITRYKLGTNKHITEVSNIFSSFHTYITLSTFKYH